MKLLAIDPGPEQSAWVIFDSTDRIIIGFGIANNAIVLGSMTHPEMLLGPCVIEKVAGYGRPVGAEVFETVYWSGRFAERWLSRSPRNTIERIERRMVKRHLCGSENKVNDAVLRQRIIDLYGGKEKAVGRKATPGPLYGIKADCWAAMAVAITYAETHLTGGKHDDRTTKAG